MDKDGVQRTADSGQVKLNLGCDKFQLPGYMNLDIKNGPGEEAYPLTFADNSVDEIRASHLLEHFGSAEVPKVLVNWGEKLKPGGVIKIAVPDFRKIVDNYVGGEGKDVLAHVMGAQVDENDFHKCLFDRSSLTQILEKVGFVDVEEWIPEHYDTASLPVSLNLKAKKAAAGEDAYDGTGKIVYGDWENARKPVPATGEPNLVDVSTAEDLEKGERKFVNSDDGGDIKISAIMSMPRIAVTENMFCAMRSILPLGIGLEKGCGVFWSQVLTRMIEGHLDDGTEFILTIDYDTWFTEKHVQRLMQIMVENPHIDALLPMQTHREENSPLIGMMPKDGEKKVIVDASTFANVTTKVDSGHFGLTLLRMSTLKKLPKPWFVAKPDPNGGWDDGRLDSDIYFWKNMRENGGNIHVANHVNIGHIQLMCTFPGPASQAFRPIHTYLTDLEKGKVPVDAIPKIEMLK